MVVERAAYTALEGQKALNRAQPTQTTSTAQKRSQRSASAASSSPNSERQRLYCLTTAQLWGTVGRVENAVAKKVNAFFQCFRSIIKVPVPLIVDWRMSMPLLNYQKRTISMELSLPEALQKAIEAQKAGHFDEARELYLAILQAQPTHPSANFNMGMLAVGINKLREALPFFKAAYESKPANPQFVWGYVVALVKLGHVIDAKSVFRQVKASGAKSDLLDQLEKQLTEIDAEQTSVSEPNILDKLKLDQVLRLARQKYKEGFVGEALNICKDILVKFPKNKNAIELVAILKSNSSTNSSKSTEPSSLLLQAPLALFSLGQLSKALEQVTQLLVQFPQSAVLHNMQGVAHAGLRQFDSAINSFKKATHLKPDYADAYFNIGKALKDKGDLDASIESFKQAIRFKPNYADAYLDLGNALKDKGDLDASIESYQQAMKIKPDYADAYYNKGVALKEKGDLDASIESFKQTIRFKPNYADAYYNKGIALKEKGDLDASIESYKQAIKIKPDYAEAYYNIGIALKAKGDLDASIESYKQAIKIKPHYAEAYNNMGVSLKDKGDLDAAIESYQQAIKIKPDYAEAYNNLGNCLADKGKLDSAIKIYNQAIKIKPEYAEAHNNMGVSLQYKGDLEAAIVSFKQAIKIKPDYADAYKNKSYAYLLKMDFQNGWSAYEWRWNIAVLDSRPLSSSRPIWEGQINKRVLLWPEQGIGDEIMFMSVAQELAAQCERLIIKMDDRLIPLFCRSFGHQIEIVGKNVDVDEDEYDFHIPMGSAVKFFRSYESDFEKTSGGVLHANLQKVEEFKQKLNIAPEKKLIGLSWGSENRKIGTKKSINLEALLSKFDPLRYEFVNLQYGDVLDQLEKGRKATGITIHQIDSVNNRDDIDGLSAIIAACDYVVSISNVTAHLAGALGKNTHILLHYTPDWRWQLNRKDSPWYKSITLYRQENFDDWSSPLEALKQYFDSDRYQLNTWQLVQILMHN